MQNRIDYSFKDLSFAVWISLLYGYVPIWFRQVQALRSAPPPKNKGPTEEEMERIEKRIEKERIEKRIDQLQVPLCLHANAHKDSSPNPCACMHTEKVWSACSKL
jgi:hypothetical protein